MDTVFCVNCDKERLVSQPECPFCGERRIVVYAKWTRRFWAWLIDGVTVWGVIWTTWLVGQYLRAQSSGREYSDVLGLRGDGDDFVLQLYAVLGIGWVFTILWHAMWITSPSHGTPGHRACGFRILRMKTLEPVPFGRAFLRELVKLGTFLVGNGIKLVADAVLMGVTERRQSVHDMALSTVAVERVTDGGTATA